MMRYDEQRFGDIGGNGGGGIGGGGIDGQWWLVVNEKQTSIWFLYNNDEESYLLPLYI